MDLATVVKVAHALAGVALVVGLVGRSIVLGLAARSTSVASVRVLVAASAPFERLTILGSAIVLGLGIATAVIQGRPFLGPLQGARVDWLFVSLVLYLSLIPLVP